MEWTEEEKAMKLANTTEKEFLFEISTQLYQILYDINSKLGQIQEEITEIKKHGVGKDNYGG